MNITLPYGSGEMSATLDWAEVIGTIDVGDAPAADDVTAAVRSAVDNPIGMDTGLFAQVQPGQRVTIITSDSFRTTQSAQFLPPIIDGLNKAGIPDEAIAFLVATGTHRGPTDDELRVILGDALHARFRDRAITSDAHDASAFVHLGDTSRGTPVQLHRAAAEADYVIVTGSVVLHYFGGFGGGRKSILPGIASVETIAANHSMNLHPTDDTLDPAVAIGKMDGNPVAEDMAEGARMLKADFLINTVLNRQKQIAGIFAGDMEAAHAEACAMARDLFAVPIKEQADLVIASSGPIKNFVQTHKALFNAYQAVKPEGRIILLCECPEGIGGEQFQKWLRLGDRQSIIKGLRERAEINGQTALSSIGKGPMTTFVTSMAASDVALLKGTRANDLAEALDGVRRTGLASSGNAPTCYFMPSAAYTVPLLDAN